MTVQRTPLIAGNWKMHKTIPEAVDAAGRLAALLKGKDLPGEVMLAPAFPGLAPVAEVLRGTGIHVGAQNLSWETEGAFTGEVSGGMLRSAGCAFVLIGHSERRQYFFEGDKQVNQKIRMALAAALRPVLCVGETEAEREEEKTLEVLDKQVRTGLKDFVRDDLRGLVLAYEPVWAIGTGKTATSRQAQEVHAFIRNCLADMFDDEFAAQTRILYGGSVKSANIAELMRMPDIDGGLVGGASLDPEEFARIICFTG